MGKCYKLNCNPKQHLKRVIYIRILSEINPDFLLMRCTGTK